MSEIDKTIVKNGVLYRKVLPESGWAYVIAAAFTVTSMAINGPANSFGLIYNDFFVEVDASSKLIGLLNGLMMFLFSTSALLGGTLMKKFTYRTVGFIGVTLYCGGTFMTMFVKSMIMLIISQGVVMSTGLGIVITVLLSSLNLYFSKRKGLIMSICQITMGLNNIVFPILINLSKKVYGFHGTLALIAAFSFHAIPSILSIQPIEKHYKLIKVDDQYINEEGLDKVDETKNKDANETVQSVKKYESPGAVIYKLIKDPIYLNISIGMSISLLADTLFTLLLPIHLFDINFTQDQVALVLTVKAIGDLFGRLMMILLFGLCSSHVTMRIVYLIGMTVGIFIKGIQPFICDYYIMLLLSSLYGIMRSSILTTQPLILSEHVTPDIFPLATGLQMAIYGLCSLILVPVITGVTDVTGSYRATLLITTSLSLVCTIPWSIEYINKRRNKHNSTPQTNVNNESSQTID